jgi:hypothetical protein
MGCLSPCGIGCLIGIILRQFTQVKSTMGTQPQAPSFSAVIPFLIHCRLARLLKTSPAFAS